MSLSLPQTDFIEASDSASGRDEGQVGALAVEAGPRVEGGRRACRVGDERGLLLLVEGEALVGVLADREGLVGVQLPDAVPVVLGGDMKLFPHL